jgi:hypothetical protein
MANDAGWPSEPTGTHQAQRGTVVEIITSCAPASGAYLEDWKSAAAGPYSIALADVLETLVEGWLLGDLESMATEIKPKDIGAVGYPMAMAVLAGSELLGALVSDITKSKRIGNYWTRYMAKVDRKYGDLGEIATDLFRNGIAHSYLSRPGVAIVRGDRRWHLRRSRLGVTLECVQLYEDFCRSYTEHAKPFILEHARKAQGRLDRLIEHDHLKARLVANLSSERWPVADAETDLTFAALIQATPIHLRGPS